MENWGSRRSPIFSKKGICSSSQPLASAVGVKILQSGGNAADACIAMAATLNVVEPCCTGIGGDAFSLYFDSSTSKVTCMQGNGSCGSNLSLDALNSRGYGVGEGLKPLDPYSGLCVTVPGAAALWESMIQKHGKLSLKDVLAPAIDLAENGFPISTIIAEQWTHGFLQGEEAFRVFRPDGLKHNAGDLIHNKDLAQTFKDIAEKGTRDGFYTGRIADKIVEATRKFGGVLDLQDLANHETCHEDPISFVYKGIRVYETPPPTHGLAALIALGLMEKVQARLGLTYVDDLKARRGSEFEAHLGVECMRLAFADALQYISDPRVNSVPSPSPSSVTITDALLNDDYLMQRSLLVGDTAIEHLDSGDVKPYLTGETVYFCCVDGEGNGCSFINSNYMGFGTGIVPEGTGFTLQNRGHNFSLEPGHPNVVAPNKRPYHTIIPALATRESDGSLYATFGNMGGFMQPMGHFQLLRNLVDFKLDPQTALDSPRWYIDGVGMSQSPKDVSTSSVLLEDGYGGRFDGGKEDSLDCVCSSALKQRGHRVGDLVKDASRTLYGKGQIICRNNITGVLCGGSDPRSDGCAIPAI